MNDLCQVSEVLKLVLFADDTNIFCSGNDLQLLVQETNKELEKIKLWFDTNKLSLNLKKTKLMMFGNGRNNLQIEIMLDGVNIEKVNEIKILGVIIDNKANWKPHISHVRSKVSRSIAIIGRARQVLNPKSLRMLYCSLVLPYFTYCVEMWGNNYTTTVQPLVILQKRALRIIHGASYREHTNIFFMESKLLKFKNLVDLQTTNSI